MTGNQALSIAPGILGGFPVRASRPPDDASPPPETKEYYTDEDGSEVITYEATPDGKVESHDSSDAHTSPSDGMIGEFGKIGHFFSTNKYIRKIKQFLVPDNMPNSVSADYKATRTWNFFQSTGWNMANYASGAALAIALGLNPIWGGAAMATFNLIKDKLGLFTGFASTLAVPAIDRNPRPWMIAGEVLDHAGMIVESATSLTAAIPGALLPLGLTGCLLRTISGSVKGPSMANIEPRQAMAGNLGEIQKKNSNQNVISNIIGSLAGVYAIKGLMAMGVGALSPAIVAGVGAALAIGSVVGMVKSMDFHPVNEKALRRVIDGMEKDKKIVGPDPSLWNALKTLRQPDTIVMGDKKLQPSPENIGRIRELKKLYAGRNYLLDVKEGKTSIYLNKRCTIEDRLTATIQGIYVDRLKNTDDYGKLLADKGADTADHWLIKGSLEKTPSEVKPLLKAMERAGWSTDLLRSCDSGKRSTWSGIPEDEELQYELALPVPPGANHTIRRS
jgi:hypothetical protein